MYILSDLILCNSTNVLLKNVQREKYKRKQKSIQFVFINIFINESVEN